MGSVVLLWLLVFWSLTTPDDLCSVCMIILPFPYFVILLGHVYIYIGLILKLFIFLTIAWHTVFAFFAISFSSFAILPVGPSSGARRPAVYGTSIMILSQSAL